MFKGITNVLVEVTENCPLDCRHCYLKARRRRKHHLPVKTFASFIQILRDHGGLFLTLTGGEPLLHPHVDDLLKIAADEGYVIRIYSSLQNVSESLFELISAFPVMEIETSLCGASDDEHDSVTGVKGSFYRTVEAIKRLRKEGVKVNIKMIITRENFSQIALVKRLARELDVNFFASPVILPCGGDFRIPEKFLTKRQLKELFETHADVAGGVSPRRVVFPLCNIEKGIFLSSRGEVRRCMEHPEILGHLPEDDLKAVLESSRFREAANIAREPPIAECKECAFIQWCRPCPALLKNDTVKKLMIEQFCRIAHVRYDITSRT